MKLAAITLLFPLIAGFLFHAKNHRLSYQYHNCPTYERYKRTLIAGGFCFVASYILVFVWVTELSSTTEFCSGLIAPDTLIRDNSSQTLRCHYESEKAV